MSRNFSMKGRAMIELSDESKQAISEIFALVFKKYRFRYATVDHLMLGLLTTREVREILKNQSIDVDKFSSYLKKVSFDMDAEKLEHFGEYEYTISLQEVFTHAELSVINSGKDVLYPYHFLFAICKVGRDTNAFRLLEKFNFDLLKAQTFVSRGGGKVKYKIEKSSFPFDDEDEKVRGDEKGQGDESVREGFSQGRDNSCDGCSESEIDCLFNLTDAAAKGELDPVIGRASEVEDVLRVLSRRKKNSVLLVGEAGCGKTAIVEGLAQRLIGNDVPDLLSGKQIFALDVTGLLSGTRYRGDFEEKMKKVVEKILDLDALLFIDEFHMVVGAGASANTNIDVVNILKPLLSSGRIRCIGATTYDEYKKYVSGDKALCRRLQKIDILEPSSSDCVEILKGLRGYYEKFHGVHFTDEALECCVKLSVKHLAERFLPDKAIDVLDEAGAVNRLRKGKTKLTEIGKDEIYSVVSKMARIPLENLTTGERDKLLDLDKRLGGLVFGQQDAINSVVSSVRLSYAGLRDTNKPIASFIFAGPTGVGKTELAKQLASVMGIDFVRFDMSEYSAEFTVSNLIGSSAGYVGYENGGKLTEEISRHPYCVLLLDEIEKAHGRVYDLLLQVMDNGFLTDNHGRKVDFRNVILIMTSNVGAIEMSKAKIGFGGSVGGPVLNSNVSAFESHFRPEFRNRLDGVIWFGGLSSDLMERIAEKFFNFYANQVLEKGVVIKLSASGRRWLAEHGFDQLMGARPMGRLINEHICKPLSEAILFGDLKDGGEATFKVVSDKLTMTVKK